MIVFTFFSSSLSGFGFGSSSVKTSSKWSGSDFACELSASADCFHVFDCGSTRKRRLFGFRPVLASCRLIEELNALMCRPKTGGWYCSSSSALILSLFTKILRSGQLDNALAMRAIIECRGYILW